MRRVRDAGGFTLLEVLVALVVFGLIMAGLTQTVHFGLSAWQSQARAIGRDSDLDGAERVLRLVLTRIAPGQNEPNVVGTASRFAFTSVLPEGLAGQASREADIVLEVDAAHRLLLRWVAHRHAVPLGAAVEPAQAELIGGVERVVFGYWSVAGGWQAAWRDRSPPDLVRVSLRFPAGDARHWPDIVVAPQRRRLEG